ncbi:fumarylacetoacetate hydrolase family protein [Naasia aerilata]|uniref:Fumarylacetoacetate hydrolase n=1 Tax=Naasia aerilata TaxID=1162966 RepID=A0ABN6XPD9_9MICO|nr:fumarylacetoacetate hydrolase family protein [Naasia aerilata]BDZ45500.1 fumarylacetoacetate hydrolase [Naasia aerilata]
MRIANLSGRLVIISGAEAVDVESASGGRFSADPQAVYERWPEFLEWAAGSSPTTGVAFSADQLQPPTPCPRQVFAIGLNYHDHASEVGLVASEVPIVFTKFVSSFAGPTADVPHPGGEVDWEVELVVVIGAEARNVAEADAWDYVAGLTMGQDISERKTQHAGATPQFSLGKSFPAFSPMGPWIVTPDEFADPRDVALETVVNGVTMQSGRTSDMVASVAMLIASLSRILVLLPGDVIFTGTPAGVGLGMKPPRYLSVGDELVTRIEGIGEMRNRIVAGV